MNTLETAELIASIILRDFQSQGYGFTVPKSRIRLAETEKKEKKKRKNTDKC